MKVVVKSILFVCLLTLGVGCKQSENKNRNKDLIVNIANVKNQVNNPQKEFTFISQPYRSSELSFRIGGPINQFEVFAGNFYKRGSVIAEIDSRDFRIRKERAEAIYRQCKTEFLRIEALFNKNNVSASSYEKAKADYTSAKTAYETATNELNDTKLIAPFDGYIGEVYIEKYQDVKATQPIVSFVDINQLKIEAYVTQDIAFNAQDLNNITLRFDAMPNQVFEARVIEVSKSTTKNNLSYLLTALLTNKNQKLLAGMSGKMTFDIASQTTTEIITIPQTALCHRPTVGDFVWVVNPDSKQVSRRKITSGDLLDNGQIAVINGLNEGEVVATSSLRFLSEGTQIKIAQKDIR